MAAILTALTGAGLLVGGLLLVVSVITGKTWLRNFVIGGVSVWAIFYLAMLIGFSVTSKEKELSLNEPKEFCGFYLDCHMHTAVAGVQRSRKIGNKTAEGEFYIVTVEVFSDAVKATLGLHAANATVVDSNGRYYGRDFEAEKELTPQPEFEKQIRPEERFRKEIVFDLPRDVTNPRLDIREGILPELVVEKFLIGDEDSLLHKRAYFKLDVSNQTAGIK